MGTLDIPPPMLNQHHHHPSCLPLQMPTIAIATDGERYIFYQYTPATTSASGVRTERSLTYSEALVVHTDPESVAQDPPEQRVAAVKLLSWLVGALKSQMQLADEIMAKHDKALKEAKV